MHRLAPFLLMISIAATPLRAQDDIAAPDEAHRELRAVREAAIAALNKNDIDELLKYVHPNVVLTAPHLTVGREVSRGHEGVKAYYDKMLTGPDRRADKLTSKVDLDEQSIVYGDDTAIAWGTTADTYDLVDGTQFTIPNRWSCTLVKENGKWLIAEFHVSTNPFQNPILSAITKQVALYAGVIAVSGGLFVGMILGVVIARRWAKKSP